LLLNGLFSLHVNSKTVFRTNSRIYYLSNTFSGQSCCAHHSGLFLGLVLNVFDALFCDFESCTIFWQVWRVDDLG